MRYFLALLPLLVCEQTLAADAVVPWQGPGLMKLLETLFWLACILAFIFILARVLRKLQQAPRGGGSSMHIVNVLQLGNREKIFLLRVADKHILLGSTQQSISALHVFDQLPEPVELDSAPRPTGNFANVLAAVVGGHKR